MNLVDFDFASLYPSDLRQFNIAPHTQIGMIIIANMIHSKENRRRDPQFVRGGAFLEDFGSRQWLEVGSRWYNLPNFEQLVGYVRDFYMTVMRPHSSLGFENSTGKLINPIIDMSKPHNPIVRNPPFEVVRSWSEEWRNYVRANPNQSF